MMEMISTSASSTSTLFTSDGWHSTKINLDFKQWIRAILCEAAKRIVTSRLYRIDRWGQQAHSPLGSYGALVRVMLFQSINSQSSLIAYGEISPLSLSSRKKLCHSCSFSLTLGPSASSGKVFVINTRYRIVQILGTLGPSASSGKMFVINTRYRIAQMGTLGSEPFLARSEVDPFIFWNKKWMGTLGFEPRSAGFHHTGSYPVLGVNSAC